MTTDSLPIMPSLVALTAASSAILGGAFFAFSAFVMPGLARLRAEDGVAAMQAINLAAPRSLLMVPLLVSAAGSAAVGVHALVAGGAGDRPLRLVAAATGLACFAITAAANVPRNDALAALTPRSPDLLTQWATYLSQWTALNHVRTGAALVSAALLVAQLVRGR